VEQVARAEVKKLIIIKNIKIILKMNKRESIFVFNGENANFALGIYSTKEKALDFIVTNKLSGVLTKYPLDIDVYNWTIEEDFFKVKNEQQKTAKFIQNFSSAYLEHWHIENGLIEGEDPRWQ
jgi:hypothetical protein